ncbi:cytochrome p450, partial [Rhyzopertha dominica]
THAGSKWHTRRKLLTPAFHFKSLQSFVETFKSCGDILIKKLQQEVGKPATDIHKLITLCALDTICESAMGIKVNAQFDEDSVYTKTIDEYLRIALKRKLSAWKTFNVLYKYSDDYKKSEELVRMLHQFTGSVITQRKNELGQEKGHSKSTKMSRKTAFLDLLLEINSKTDYLLSDEDIREEMDTFMFAGHDTVSSALSFLLYEVARHTDVQEKIVDELKETFGNDFSTDLSYEGIKRMQYLSCVIKEALRLYPPVPVMERGITDDIVAGNYRIPRNVTVMINVFGMHRAPEYFPDPEKFDPERFTPENSLGKHSFCYVPFSAGARNCIGQKFAMLEMLAITSKILMNFELHPVDDPHELQLRSYAILKSRNGVPIKITRRE